MSLNAPGSKDPQFTEASSAVEPAALASHLYRSIVFQEPDRLVEPPSWVEHIPFAFWVVEALGPSVFVELGTHSGNSYAAFAQAVQTLGLPCACFAVDTWKGDPQAGTYDESVFAEWREYHDRHFSDFSTLIRASFAEAACQFGEKSIDLLHLDGYHTVDAVRQDLQDWLPKMSHKGVMLLHDINVREADFGAWQVWEQIEGAYPSFKFLHGHGLGVLGVGRDFPEPITWLFNQTGGPPDQLTGVRHFFSRLGRRFTLQSESRRHQQAALSLESRLVGERDQIASQLTRYQEEARAIESRLVGERDQLVGERDQLVGERDQMASGLARSEQHVLALETDLLVERKRNEALACERETLRVELEQHRQTARELDAEVRGLAARLDNLRPPASPFRQVQHARIWRTLAACRAILWILSLAARSGSWRDVSRIFGRLAFNPRKAIGASMIAGSGLFDERYYVTGNPDVALSRVHPLIHYVLWGAFEGRRPHALFDPAYYLEQYPDVARARCEPLSHFLRHGTSEERNPGPYFDTKSYLSTNRDVRESGINPLVHFLNIGWREGRSPLPTFDCAAYSVRYEDVRSSGVNPLVHFVEVGRMENRDVAPAARAPLPALPRVRLTAQALRHRTSDPPVILCLTHVCPFPPYTGNAYRINRMLLSLQNAGFRILPVIVPLSGEEPDDEAIRNVEKTFSNVVVVNRNGAIRYSLTDVPDVLASLNREHTPRYSAVLGEDAVMSGRARELLIINRTYCHDAAIAAVLRLHSALRNYVVLTEYVWMTRVLPLLDGRAIAVIDTIDVFSSKKDKVVKYGIRDFWLEPEEEARQLELGDLVIAIQSDEREMLRQLVPNRTLVTAGIDFDVVGDPRLPAGRRILYVGSGNPMNVRGLREFLRFAWPAVQKEVTDAELVVAGAVGDALEAPPPGVEVVGQVADLRELYRSARVVINPAIAGTGMKIKTVEALSHLRPIVTWPTGVDGLPDDLRNSCDVVRDWFEFGSRVTARLVTDRDDTFSPAERKVIQNATSPEVVYADLIVNIRKLWEQRVGSAETVTLSEVE